MTSSAIAGEIRVSPSPDAVARDVADWLAELSGSAVARHGRFCIALAGGSTPKTLYSLLATPPFVSRFDWPKWWCFFGDERACPADDPSSNYQMAASTLLTHVPVNPAQVFRMPAERQDLAAAARDYSRTLEEALGNPPVFDCVLLGLGENGHTASLFPATPALDVTDAWCTPGLADYEPVNRLTLTYAAINAAREVAFLVTGDKKADAFAGVAAGKVPAARVQPSSGNLHWFLDSAAAATLP